MKKTKFILCILILLCIAVIINVFVLTNEFNKSIQEYNNGVYELIGLIKEKYPSVSKEEIINILNGKESSKYIEEGKKLANNYGIDNEESAILKLEDSKNNIIIYSSGIIIALAILITIIWLLNNFIQKRKISKITEYIREINRKNYELKIKENGEDELSNLRNELYKITIMLKEEAENSKKDKKFLAKSLQDISHQIKTPLTSITIMLDEIKDNENMDDETKQKFIYEISRQAEKISFLSISLLKLSKLDSGTVEFEKKKYNLKELVKEAIRNLEIPLEIKNQEVISSLKEAYIIGDYKWTLEAITNIIKNCIEHTKENKKIYVEIRETNVYTELIIRDEGEGIEEKDLKHIFDRFYKGKNSSENSFGIGLSLSKSILEKQNASITCASRLNEGTTFKIYFYER